MTNLLPFLREEVEQSVVARWRQVAHHFAARIAVTTPDGEELTYQALDECSDQIACALLDRLGVENRPVILLLDHHPRLIAAIIGVLKANKAYVALTPAQTTELADLLKTLDAPQLVITTREHSTQVRTITGSRKDILFLEEVGSWRTRPDVEISPTALAALFFTSGTAGQPKGVPYSQRMILHRVWVETNACQLTAADRFSGLRAGGVAASVRDFFNPLLNGGALCLYPIHQYGLAPLSAWLLNQNITYFHLPGLLYREWLETLSADACFPALRYLSPSGRKTIRDCERLWPHLAPDACLISTYATTETSLLSYQFITRQTPLAEELLAVGTPAPDKQIMLVDEQGQIAPAGQVGEVVVRSRYIASGYWQQPELSTQRFSLTHDNREEIIYRTGDFGRLRSDGALELVGRQDSQVKVRGYRVMLDEVETLLAKTNGVAQAAARIFPAAGGDNRLVGYVTELPGVRLAAHAIRGELTTHVAAHMIPAQIVVLSELPLTRTGKVDRQALPLPGSARPLLITPFLAPRDEVEQQLAALWADLLGLDTVGVDDNFYALGGDSLAAIRLLLQVEERFNLQIPAAFFAQPTVAHLASWVAGRVSTPLATSSHTTRTRKPALPRWQRGPLVRGYALPYSVGVKLQPLWIRLPAVRALLWNESAIFREWQAWLEIADPDHHKLHLSLLANTWKSWRNAQLKRPDVFSKWIDVTGSEWLEPALVAGRPLVLMTAHTALTRRIFQAMLLQKINRPFTWLGRSRGDPVARIDALSQAKTTLRQGGVVMVASDGVVGRTGVELPFLGHRWRFRSGAAALAQEAEATILPVFTTLEAGGRVKITIHPPLTSIVATGPAWINAVMSHYAARLASLWCENLSTIPWLKLKQIGASPLLAGTTSTFGCAS